MKKAIQALPNQRLIDERLRHHWTQQEVADRIETTRINVNRWERGVTFPGPYFRQQLCTLFGKSTGELGLQEENEAIIQREPATEGSQPVASSAVPTPLPTSSSFPGSTQSQVDRRRILIGLAGGAATLLVARSAWLFFPASSSALSYNYISPGTTLCVYRAHRDIVRCVAWSPNGKYLTSGGSDVVVRVWTPDSDSGSTVSRYLRHQHDVHTVVWSPDGKRIASTDWYGVQIWDAFSGVWIGTYTGHTDLVRAIAWSPDGQYIASGSEDHTVQVWHAETREPKYVYKGHTGKVLAVSWPLHGQRIASGGWDRTVQVWDAFTGIPAYTYHGHLDKVHTVAWSHDGTRIASGSADKTLRIWNAASGTYLSFKSATRIVSLAWSPDSKRVAFGGYDQVAVQVIDATTSRNIFTYTGHTDNIQTVAWSPDGRRIASGGGDTTVRVWQY